MTPRLACFRGQAQISTWLTTIVRNCTLMQLRKPPRQIHVPLDEQFGEEQARSLWEGLADERPSPEEEFRKCELTAPLRKCTALLSPAVRRTFQGCWVIPDAVPAVTSQGVELGYNMESESLISWTITCYDSLA